MLKEVDMFIYEKDGKLNVQFAPGQIPAENPDIVIGKDEKTFINVDGKDIVAAEPGSEEAEETE